MALTNDEWPGHVVSTTPYTKNSAARTIHLILGFWATAKGFTQVHEPDMAQYAACSESYVERVINELIEYGLLEKSLDDRGWTRYRLVK